MMGVRMKVEITNDHCIVITAETVVEAFALNYLMAVGKESICNECGQIKMPVTINCSILDNS